MKHRHGDICFELPEGWADGSQLLFVAPPDQKLRAELIQAAARAGGRVQIPSVAPKLSANITFNQRDYPFTMSALEFSERELRGALSTVPGAKAGEFRWGRLGPLEAFMAELEIQAEGVAAKQLHAMAVGKGRVFHFCATTPVGEFDNLRPLFVEVLSSIEID